MENYEKKYKDLIARLQKAKENDDVCDERYCCVIDEIVPELKESEDEKVRKAIIGLVKQSSEILDTQNQNNMLAWLEKQGEQKQTDEDMKEALRTEYEKGRADAIAEMQKEWSEEDEVRLQACLDTLQAKSLMGKVDTTITMWLKSLKDRYTWKPSDKQIKALKYVAYHLMPDNNYRKEMFSLYEDLKKLREG